MCLDALSNDDIFYLIYCIAQAHLTFPLISICAEKFEDGISSSDMSDILLKNRGSCTSSKVSAVNMKKVADSSPYPDEFNQKLEELKHKNFKEIDPLLSLLSKVPTDEKVKNLLRRDGGIKKNEGNIKEDGHKTNGHHVLANVSERNSHNMNGHLHKTSYEKQTKFPRRKDTTETQNAQTVVMPSWTRGRSNLSWDFVPINRIDFVNSGPIGVLPLNVQESRLIDDILFCLVGIDGDYVRSMKIFNSEEDRKFIVDESANVALQLLIEKMFLMFSHYSTIMRFVEESFEREKGLVNHALASEIRVFLKDYFILVEQLEHRHRQCNLTLQKLWFYLQPCMETMETIKNIVSILMKGNCTGGSVLSILHEHSTSLIGSSKSLEVSLSLTKAACVPYFQILEKFIYKGIIKDPYSEFFIRDSGLADKEDLNGDFLDVFWEKRYIIQKDQVPAFLEKTAETILKAGKYLNVILQYGKEMSYPSAKPIKYSTLEIEYAQLIEPAYHNASKQLLDLLMDEADLKRRFMSVKHYFFLDQSDFITQFIDMAEEELEKDVGACLYKRLESLLELAIRQSTVNEDKYKDDVQVYICPTDVESEIMDIQKIKRNVNEETDSGLTGFQAFAFQYNVKWPLSLVINTKAISYYQIIFRHLFQCKYLEMLLGRAWILNKKTKNVARSEIRLYAPAFALRQRMLNFVQNLDYYFTLEVIEPRWIQFFSQISEVENIDELLALHDTFLTSCIGDCMVMFPELLRILWFLMRLCSNFSKYILQQMKSSSSLENSSVTENGLTSIPEQSIHIEISDCPVALETFQNTVTKFEKSFDEYIGLLLNSLHMRKYSKQTGNLINMIHRLDSNRYYEEKHSDTQKK